ncbi:hypothetical protein KEJ39_04565 [Candidatus Bathyarchaeota archaeon]|nr:hypothetical protein [Candidatus Bathyarchaeota archaeon]
MRSVLLIVVLALSAAANIYVTEGSLYAFQTYGPEKTTEGVLLFTICVHVEPFGATPSRGAGYHDLRLFKMHSRDLMTLARIVEGHGGRLVVQAQTPFTKVAVDEGDTILADLEAHGHEIGLHFHEYVHLGRNPESLPVTSWTRSMTNEIIFLKKAGVDAIRCWSGGNRYKKILEAASNVGLEVMTDYKDPRSQETSPLVMDVNPWRPSGGPDGGDLTLFSQNDPGGRIVYLPDGAYDPEMLAAKREIILENSVEVYLQFLEDSLKHSLEAAQPEKLNVFHITVHLGEFRGNPSKPYSIIDDFLTVNVDPLVSAGKIRWATFSQMADAYSQWERDHTTCPAR